ncbi:MAG: DNA/RNA nuclease SfsA, partial [Oscillospiraceae bacterium]|nr:DNA/RNA nuclease SfsA [Oscillospiraceae bacterium]
MRYSSIVSGSFESRPNRFIANVSIGGDSVRCHVKNTGRCRELLVPGARVLLEKSENPNRKTAYDLVSVYKGDTLINMDSQSPNKIAAEYLPSVFPEASLIKPEVRYNSSRFDFYIECPHRKIFLEVKGVTLERDGNAFFPDAPTVRGTRHINELIDA